MEKTDLGLTQSISSDLFTSFTSSPETVVTWWKRTPAWKTVRGYWARDKWSGKMVWHTYTTSSSSPSATSERRTSASGLLTSVVLPLSSLQSNIAMTTSDHVMTAAADESAFNVPVITTGDPPQTSAGPPWSLVSQCLTPSTTPLLVQTSSQTAAAQSLHSSSPHYTTTLETPDTRNRTFTDVTPPNILAGPSTVTETGGTISATTDDAVRSLTTERLTEWTTTRYEHQQEEQDGGYWLTDERGNKLIYVRANMTGQYADAWRQFIGQTVTTTPQNRRAPRPPRMRYPSSRESYYTSLMSICLRATINSARSTEPSIPQG